MFWADSVIRSVWVGKALAYVFGVRAVSDEEANLNNNARDGWLRGVERSGLAHNAWHANPARIVKEWAFAS